MINPKNRIHAAELLNLADKIVIEVGSREGNYANHLLMQKPRILHLVDLWAEQPPEIYQDKRKTNQEGWDKMYLGVVERFKNNPNVFLHRGYSLEIAKTFHPEFADLIYIDANHKEQPCYEDICAWWPIVKPGGWMCGHDYIMPPTWSGVYPAVNRWLAENNRKLDLLVLRDKFPTWGVRKV